MKIRASGVQSPVTAMILAAGRGERMRPLTDRVPKPLLPVAGKPLIEWHIERLAAAGFRRLVINVAHHGDRIREVLGDGGRWNLLICYSDEGQGQALETGGGILRALPLLGDAPFLVVNADVWTDFDFRCIGLPPGSQAHLLLVDNPPQHARGDFALQHGMLTQAEQGRLTYAGIGVYSPMLFRSRVPGRFPLKPLLLQAIREGRASGQHYRGEWLDVGTPDRLALVRSRAGDVRPEGWY